MGVPVLPGLVTVDLTFVNFLWMRGIGHMATVNSLMLRTITGSAKPWH